MSKTPVTRPSVTSSEENSLAIEFQEHVKYSYNGLVLPLLREIASFRNKRKSDIWTQRSSAAKLHFDAKSPYLERYEKPRQEQLENAIQELSKTLINREKFRTLFQISQKLKKLYSDHNQSHVFNTEKAKKFFSKLSEIEEEFKILKANPFSKLDEIIDRLLQKLKEEPYQSLQELYERKSTASPKTVRLIDTFSDAHYETIETTARFLRATREDYRQYYVLLYKNSQSHQNYLTRKAQFPAKNADFFNKSLHTFYTFPSEFVPTATKIEQEKQMLEKESKVLDQEVQALDIKTHQLTQKVGGVDQKAREFAQAKQMLEEDMQALNQEKRTLDEELKILDQKSEAFSQTRQKLVQTQQVLEQQEKASEKEELQRKRHQFDRKAREFEQEETKLARRKKILQNTELQLEKEKQVLDIEKQKVEQLRQKFLEAKKDFSQKTEVLDKDTQALKRTEKNLERKIQDYNQIEQKFQSETDKYEQNKQQFIQQEKKFDEEIQAFELVERALEEEEQTFEKQSKTLDKSKEALDQSTREVEQSKKRLLKEKQMLQSKKTELKQVEQMFEKQSKTLDKSKEALDQSTREVHQLQRRLVEEEQQFGEQQRKRNQGAKEHNRAAQRKNIEKQWKALRSGQTTPVSNVSFEKIPANTGGAVSMLTNTQLQQDGENTVSSDTTTAVSHEVDTPPTYDEASHAVSSGSAASQEDSDEEDLSSTTSDHPFSEDSEANVADSGDSMSISDAQQEDSDDESTMIVDREIKGILKKPKKHEKEGVKFSIQDEPAAISSKYTKGSHHLSKKLKTFSKYVNSILDIYKSPANSLEGKRVLSSSVKVMRHIQTEVNNLQTSFDDVNELAKNTFSNIGITDVGPETEHKEVLENANNNFTEISEKCTKLIREYFIECSAVQRYTEKADVDFLEQKAQEKIVHYATRIKRLVHSEVNEIKLKKQIDVRRDELIIKAKKVKTRSELAKLQKAMRDVLERINHVYPKLVSKREIAEKDSNLDKKLKHRIEALDKSKHELGNSQEALSNLSTERCFDDKFTTSLEGLKNMFEKQVEAVAQTFSGCCTGETLPRKLDDELIAYLKASVEYFKEQFKVDTLYKPVKRHKRRDSKAGDYRSGHASWEDSGLTSDDLVSTKTGTSIASSVTSILSDFSAKYFNLHGRSYTSEAAWVQARIESESMVTDSDPFCESDDDKTELGGKARSDVTITQPPHHKRKLYDSEIESGGMTTPRKPKSVISEAASDRTIRMKR